MYYLSSGPLVQRINSQFWKGEIMGRRVLVRVYLISHLVVKGLTTRGLRKSPKVIVRDVSRVPIDLIFCGV